MHEIDKRIREWRQQLGRELTCRPEVLDELEGHLREELDRTLAPALDQAWPAALARLGDVKTLAGEFGKLHPPAGWWPARFVACGWIGLVLLVAAFAPKLLSGGDALLGVHVVFVLLGYLATFLAGALGASFALARPFDVWHQGRSASLRRVALPLTLFAAGCTALGVGLGMVWAARGWGSAWSGDSKEIGGVAVLLGNLALAALLAWPRVSDRWRMTAALVNSMIVHFAWFHPLLIGTPPGAAHSYGYSAFAPLLAAILMLQAVLTLGTLAPERWLRRNSGI